jgi:hypothetical protein
MMRRNRSGETEAGQTLVMFVLALFVLLGMAAVAVDVGFFFSQRRGLQNAADAAALAGAHALPENAAEARASAQEWADRNGYGAAGGAVVTIVTPYKGDAAKVEVTIEKQVPAFFARALGMNAFDVKARAVGSHGLDEVRQFGVIALNPSACGSFLKSGSGNFTVSGGGAIAVNSDCDPAIDVSGSGSVSAAAIYYYTGGGWESTGDMTPDPVPMPRPAEDPLASLAPPSLTAIGLSPDSAGTARAPATLKLTAGAKTLRPGVYYGGISISSNANVTFAPGIYIMAGGGFTLSGGGNITGLGVMFYNTYDPVNSGGAGACTGITFSGGSNATFEPMSSGPYKDILFWQDRACTQPFNHVGNGELTAGIYYLPTAQFRLCGTADTGGKQIIADTVWVNGNGNVSIASSPYLTEVYQPIRLIE